MTPAVDPRAAGPAPAGPARLPPTAVGADARPVRRRGVPGLAGRHHPVQPRARRRTPLTSRPASRCCCCRTRCWARSPACCWIAGRASGCCWRANLIRALLVCGVAIEIAFGVHGQPFYLSALVVISVNRFVLSALSASQPHVVEPERLITANAVSTTAGAVVAAIGGGSAIGLRTLLGGGNTAYALVAVAAAVAYALAGWRAAGFSIAQLGPDEDTREHSDSVAQRAHRADRRRPARPLAPVGAARVPGDRRPPLRLRGQRHLHPAAVSQLLLRRRSVPGRAGRAWDRWWPRSRSAAAWRPC